MTEILYLMMSPPSPSLHRFFILVHQGESFNNYTIGRYQELLSVLYLPPGVLIDSQPVSAAAQNYWPCKTDSGIESLHIGILWGEKWEIYHNVNKMSQVRDNDSV